MLVHTLGSLPFRGLRLLFARRLALERFGQFPIHSVIAIGGLHIVGVVPKGTYDRGNPALAARLWTGFCASPFARCLALSSAVHARRLTGVSRVPCSQQSFCGRGAQVLRFAGMLPKKARVWQSTKRHASGRSMYGNLLNAELLTLPDGRQQSWGNYGVHKCFPPGYTDQHSK